MSEARSKLHDLQVPRIAEVAPGIFSMGTGLVPYYLLEAGGKFTLIDGALPGYQSQLERFLQSRGRALDDIEAQVLTHHHPDHRGLTEKVRDSGRATVWIHERDYPYISQAPAPPKAPIWRPRVFKAIAHMVRHGVIGTAPVLEASTFEDGEQLEVPGAPRVVHVPGHTEGNRALFLEDEELIFTGDALITIDIYSWDIRPSIPADFFNDDSERALSFLENLENANADILLPGHGPVWRGGVIEAVTRARAVGIY